MTSCTATRAKAHFGALLDQIRHGPVQVLKHGHVVGVMVSAQDHEAMRNFCANRLQGLLDDVS
jgi:PHD/YefM family antitoxin component YafN of YafNO toxin-antitoxin module